MSWMMALFLVLVSATLISHQGASSLEFNKTFSLTVTSRKNQTGHFISQASVSNEGNMVPNHWKLKMHQSNFENIGFRSFQLTATFIAPPVLPVDYQLFPGVGYYKFHTTIANGFEDASQQCANEGGHLVIVNSEAEHQVLQTMFARYPKDEFKHDWAFAGFHDRVKEGEFFTIFGEPLLFTGFTRWSNPNQPDDAGNGEDCGSVYRNGGINDAPCDAKFPFFCEYDLSWTEK